MALTPSKMMPLGTKAPDFKLFDTSSQTELSLAQLRGEKGTLVMFICNHCPFVKHIESGLRKLGEDYRDSGVSLVAISSNDIVSQPADAPDKMAEKNYVFPYLYDETQQAAEAYGAACTPDFFLFDDKLLCVYRGQFDSSRPSNEIPVTGSDLRSAINALINGTTVPGDQKPSIGCNIKWKA